MSEVAAETGGARTRRKAYGVLAALLYAIVLLTALLPVHAGDSSLPQQLGVQQDQGCGAAVVALTRSDEPFCVAAAWRRTGVTLFFLLLSAPFAVAYVAACARERD